ncbi:MAG: hypothetical protein K8W52_37105, partial [Deltaproteobacteria bacterium]|nr:hypothetical protein [Deltaproteobacteria bacterium]
GALGLARRAVAIALDGPTVASARGELELALVAAGSEAGRHAELEARWRRSPGEVWQRAAVLAALVRGACRSHTVGWAADVLAGGSVASLRRACPALVERLAAMTLGAGEVSRLHAVVLTDLRAAHWYELGEVAVAVALYRAALAHARAADVPRLVCLALNNLGNTLVATDAPAALACFTEAIERARVAGLIDEELINLNNLCVTLMDTGALDDAGEVFDVAIRRVDETGRWQTFGNVIVGNLGTLYGRTAHAAMARAFLERAMTVALAAGDTAMWAAWLGNLVALMVAQDEPAVDAQLIAYGEQLQAARAGGDPEVRADAAWLLAFAHLRRGRGEEASAIALASAERSEAEGAARQALDALDLAMVAQVGAPAALEPLLARRRRLLASDASIDAGAAVEQLAALAVRIGIPATGVDDLRRRVAPGSHR